MKRLAHLLKKYRLTVFIVILILVNTGRIGEKKSIQTFLASACLSNFIFITIKNYYF